MAKSCELQPSAERDSIIAFAKSVRNQLDYIRDVSADLTIEDDVIDEGAFAKIRRGKLKNVGDVAVKTIVVKQHGQGDINVSSRKVCLVFSITAHF